MIPRIIFHAKLWLLVRVAPLSAAMMGVVLAFVFACFAPCVRAFKLGQSVPVAEAQRSVDELVEVRRRFLSWDFGTRRLVCVC